MTASSRPAGAAPSSAASLDRIAAALAAAVACIALAAASPGTDVSWLIVVGERLLNGDRLYVDLLEVNPPASVLLYLPAVWLGRVTGLPAEAWTSLTTTAVCIGALWAAGRILRPAGLLARPGLAALAASVAFLLLPGEAFAQREHIAVLLLAPGLALVMRRMAGGPAVGRLAACGVGLLSGLAICIKPQFGLALLLPQAAAAWRARSLLPLLQAENWTSLAVVAAYGAATAVWTPAFWTDMLPLLTAAYRPLRLAPGDTALLTARYAAPFLLYLAVRPQLLRQAAVPLLAALGFLVAAVEQGKGWPYHFLPAVALAAYVVLLDGLTLIAGRRGGADALRAAAAGAVALAGVALFVRPAFPLADLEAAVKATAPAPRILTLTGDIALGHPLTRRVGGEWVGLTPCQWMTANVHRLAAADPAAAARLEAVAARDRALFAQSLAREPDALLIDRADGPFWLDWARRDAAIAQRLAAYDLKASNARADLYVRRRD